MNSTIVGLMICLILLLILIGVIYYAYRTVREKVRRFSRMMFQTDSLLNGVKKVEAEYAATPKSVSGATSLYLPKLAKDFPEFHYEEMKERAENVLISYLRGMQAENVDLLTEGTQALRDELSMQIHMNKNAGLSVFYDGIHIHRTEIKHYLKNKSNCKIVFQTAVEYVYYKQLGQRTVTGAKEHKTQSKYNIECIYIQNPDEVDNISDAALGINCPNCGAPIQGVGAKRCAYCDSPVIELNIRAWSFSNVSEVK